MMCRRNVLLNNCRICNAELWFTKNNKNYVFFKGDYYCKECYAEHRKERVKNVLSLYR